MTFPGPLLCTDVLKRMFYDCVGIKTYVNITCENLFFDLKVDFFFLILNEIKTLCGPRSVVGPTHCTNWAW